MKFTTKSHLLIRAATIAMATVGIGLLQGCGGGGSSTSKPPATTLSWSVQATKTFHFTWADVSGETEYRLMENPDGSSGYTKVATIAKDNTSHDLVVSLPMRTNASYILQSCNSKGCTNSNAVNFTSSLADGVGYFKASNLVGWFGYSVAFSGDGSTMAVGSDEDVSGNGAVYLFSNNAGTWTQTGYVTASNAQNFDGFGDSVALSSDGSILAVGAPCEDGNASSNVATPNDLALNSGAVYLYSNSGGSWTQTAYLKATDATALDQFGYSVALSSDGTRLAVGAPYRSGNIGAVYLFNNVAGSWVETPAFNHSANGNALNGDNFGWSVALSADGALLAVGVPGERSNTTSVDSGVYNTLAMNSGAVYLYSYSGTIWSQQSYIKPLVTTSNDYFGRSVALSADGTTLAVGAYMEDTSATDSGAAYVFSSGTGSWVQTAFLKASNPGNGDWFGETVALSADGATLAVGGWLEDSGATGINGDQGDDPLYADSGAAYLYRNSNGSWAQEAYIKAPNTDAGDWFGRSITLSPDGNTLAVGALGEGSSMTGINNKDQTNNLSGQSGAVYLY